MRIPFLKYHALENDFLVLDSTPHLTGRILARIARHACDRHRGVGADGLIMVESSCGEFRMRLFNADGSEAEISGNGLRILAHHLFRHKRTRRKSFVIRSAAGENRVTVVSSRGGKAVSRISLGKPRFALPEIPMKGAAEFFINAPFAVASGELVGTAVSVGNPHIVFFVDTLDFDWPTFGREVECDPRFPERTNVEFGVIRSRSRIVHQSWERGVGITRASGTGAASTVAAGIINGYLDREVTVCEPAGELQITIGSLDDDILLTGPSEYIGEGSFVS